MSRRKTVQDFQFGSRLGEGSYSQVFKGVDVSSRKVFAIKVLSKKHIVKEKKIKYVNIEKITLNRLGRHPGIVTLYYTFQDDNSLYFVIDLAEHGELLTLIRKLGSLSENCAKYYMIQLIDAVDFMHKKGVIHRDLKPENILLNGDMRLMITDFGAAKILDLDESGKVIENEEAFAKGSFVGTAEYVSPELLKHNKCGFESDIWAIGCILYQFIIGVPPFKGKTEYATFEKIVNLQYQWPSYFIPELIKDVVARLLMSDPQERLTMSQLQQHPWFSRLNWDDKAKIWGTQPPKMEQYRPIVEQQLQQNTQQMSKIVIQKKLPAATVKKQLLSNTINQIRSDNGNNHLYNGLSKDGSKRPAASFAPPIKTVNGMNGPLSSSKTSPLPGARPILPKIQNVSPLVSPLRQRPPQIPQQQQFTPPRPAYPPQGSAQRSPNQQGQSPVSQPKMFAQSPSQSRSPNVPLSMGNGFQIQQSPIKLREAAVVRSSPAVAKTPLPQKISPVPPITVKSNATPISSPRPQQDAVKSNSPDEKLIIPALPPQALKPKETPKPVATPSTATVVQSSKQSILRAAEELSSAGPKSVQAKPTGPMPSKKPLSKVDDVKPQSASYKAVTKPPQLSLPPKPKSSVPRSQPPKLQPPSIVTKTTASPVTSKPMPKARMTPVSSPRITSAKSPQTNGAIKGPTEVLKYLTKDEQIVKLDFINFAELDLASLRTFDPTSNLSKLSSSIGLDDVLIHEIITRSKRELEDGTRRVVLVITDFGNLYLFTSTVSGQQLTYQLGIDLTDKMFAMYDYEFNEYDQSGYLILEVLKMDKLVFLSPLEKHVQKDLKEVSAIQQGTTFSWIDALMKTKELLKQKANASSNKSSPSSSTPSPKSSSGSSTRGTTPINTTANSGRNATATRRVSSGSTTQKTAPRVVVRNTSTNGKKPQTMQQILQQNKKFAGGAAAAAFKSSR